MSRCIAEIMNRELMAVTATTSVDAVREILRAFGISVVPVLDDNRRPLGIVTAGALLGGEGTAEGRMTRPASCVDGSARIEAAARILAQSDAHHLVVVDSAGIAIGIVSAPDLLRGLLGVPAHHPAAFPHWNPHTRSSWTDDWPVDAEHARHAPETPGVLVLACESVGETDVVVWAEACGNVRERLRALTRPASRTDPALGALLQRRDLRFRATAPPDAAERERIASALRGELARRPPPGAT